MICRFPNSGYSYNGTEGHYTPWPNGQKGEDSPTHGIHTVFSVDGSPYQQWQADLLAYSHRKVGQPGGLTRLLSSYARSTPFAGRTFLTYPYSPHPFSGDDYAPYNKPRALGAWLKKSPPAEETVLILDPDCVFLEPLTEPVSRGYPVAQPISYLYPLHIGNQEFIKKHCANPELVSGVGIPTLIHRDDLAEVTPLWLKKTEEIRQDPQSRQWAGWVAEMWAYAFAAAELGLEHTTRELAQFPLEDRADLPIIHYCYDSSDIQQRWRWGKRAYRPWERVPEPPPDGVTLSSRVLIGLLNEWVAIQRQQICLR